LCGSSDAILWSNGAREGRGEEGSVVADAAEAEELKEDEKEHFFLTLWIKVPESR
jgi:hypothetical protein